MKLLRNLDSVPIFPCGTIAAIGNFDGVHLGHQALLAALRAKATELGLPMVVIVFEPQTREYFLKNEAPPRLSRLRDKIQILQKMGVDYVCCLRFNRHFAQMEAIDFANAVIFSSLQVKYLVVGDDFRFGCDRRGDVNLLQKLGENYQAQVSCCPDFESKGRRISSTRVRQALQLGDLNEAEQLLGRKYTLCGRVIYGDGLGRTWGIPTANLKMTQATLPLRGVFCVNIRCANGLLYQGVANIGKRPTLDGTKSLLEVHVFDFAGSLYGQRIEVIFLLKLRDEKAFTSKDQLIDQIHADVRAAKDYFSYTLNKVMQ